MQTISHELVSHSSNSYLILGTRPLNTLWIHPEIERRINPSFGLRSYSEAINEGLLWPSDRRPWHFLSPALQDRFLGRIVSRKGLERLRLGPEAHERFIFRTMLACRGFLDIAKVTLDEGVFAGSLPAGWGATGQVHPDILIAPQTQWLPRIWIECERTIRKPCYYQSKIERIPPSHVLVYVVPSIGDCMKLKRRFEKIFRRPRPRHYIVVSEKESRGLFQSLIFKFKLFSSVGNQKMLGEGSFDRHPI